MPYNEIVILLAKSREAAAESLRELKRLDREGWVDLTWYALLDDDTGGLRIREASDHAEGVAVSAAMRISPAKGLTGAVMEATAGLIATGLQSGDAALVVTVDQRYSERVIAELEARGPTLRVPMQDSRLEVVLRASIEEIRGKLTWLAELLEHETEKLDRTSGSEKERIETGIRAARTEVAAERLHLQARLAALRNELENRLLENARIIRHGSGAAALAADKYTEELEREIADINEDLALSILDHLDALATHACDLREKAAKATGADAVAIEEQADELELHMRKYRADLSATLAASASIAHHCVERLQKGAGMRKASVEMELQHHRKKLEQRHELLKADIRHLQREDSHCWRVMTAKFRNSWLSLREATYESLCESH